MTIDELSALAAKNKRPDQAEPHDLLAWYELRELYREYKSGQISKARGETEKARILSERQKFLDRAESVRQDVQNRAAFWKSVEQAATDYNTSPSLDTADKFLKTVYGTGRINGGR